MSRKVAREQREGIAVGAVLLEAGVPLFVAKPALDKHGEWLPAGGANGCGYWFPEAWQATTTDGDALGRWRPGDALCAVMGHVVDGLDVDPRNGGKKSAKKLRKAGMWPESLGHQLTPSDGYHDLIACLDVVSRDNLEPGLDFKGGTAAGTGRGFLFIAPTVKLSKTTKKLGAYRWETVPTLAGLVP